MSDFKKIIPVILCVIALVAFHITYKESLEDTPTTPQEAVEITTSEGLALTLNSDGLGYTLSGIGSCTATHIVVHTHNDLPITYISADALKGCEDIRSITLTNVIMIGDSAFQNCTRLKSISLPETLVSVGAEAFKGCEDIVSISLPDSVTVVGDAAFEGCVSLSSAKLSSQMVHLNEFLFKDCKKLKSIDIPEGIVCIETEVFTGCTSLAKISLPDSATTLACRVFNDTAYYQNKENWDDKALYIGKHLITVQNVSGQFTVKEGTLSISNDAFYACDHMTVVYLPESIISIGEEAFYECKHLHSITLPQNLSHLGRESFFECRHIATITIPEKITKVEAGAFQSCHDLQSVVLGSGVTTIESGAFYDCWSLSYIFYMGTQEEYANIRIEAYNDSLQIANVFYYSEEQPTAKGNYWKLVNGTPVIWEG